MQRARVGLSLGLIFGFGGGIGTLAGGYLTDRLGKNDRSWYLKIPAIAILISIVFAAGTLFLPTATASLTCLFGCTLMQSMYLGPSIAVSHSLVPAPMRAFTSAIFFLAINLVGLGFGPLVVGIISDKLTPAFGNESLRWAISIILPMSIISSSMLFVAAKKLTIDLPINSK